MNKGTSLELWRKGSRLFFRYLRACVSLHCVADLAMINNEVVEAVRKKNR